MVHQPWLGGATLKWAQVLAMLSVRAVAHPAAYYLYYDVAPRRLTAQWRARRPQTPVQYLEPEWRVHPWTSARSQQTCRTL